MPDGSNISIITTFDIIQHAVGAGGLAAFVYASQEAEGIIEGAIDGAIEDLCWGTSMFVCPEKRADALRVLLEFAQREREARIQADVAAEGDFCTGAASNEARRDLG